MMESPTNEEGPQGAPAPGDSPAVEPPGPEAPGPVEAGQETPPTSDQPPVPPLPPAAQEEKPETKEPLRFPGLIALLLQAPVASVGQFVSRGGAQGLRPDRQAIAFMSDAAVSGRAVVFSRINRDSRAVNEVRLDVMTVGDLNRAYRLLRGFTDVSAASDACAGLVGADHWLFKEPLA